MSNAPRECSDEHVVAEMANAHPRSPTRLTRFDRYFLGMAAFVLITAAALKGVALVVEFPGSRDRDPIIWFLPSNLLSVFLIGLEIWVAVFALSSPRWQSRYSALLMLSSGFLGYRFAKWYYFRDSSCDCLGSVFARWGDGSLEFVALGSALLLFLVPLCVLIRFASFNIEGGNALP